MMAATLAAIMSMLSIASAEEIPWAWSAAVMDALVTAPEDRESRAVLSAADIRPAAEVVAAALGMVIVRSTASVTWPVESDLIWETVKVPPQVGEALAVGLPVRAV